MDLEELHQKYEWNQIMKELLSLAIYLKDEKSDYSRENICSKINYIIKLMDELDPAIEGDIGVLMHKFEWGKVKQDLVSLALDSLDDGSEYSREEAYTRVVSKITYIDTGGAYE